MLRRDRTLWTALAAGFLLRLAPRLAWPKVPCVRDECTYKELAQSFLDGEGMVGTHGWLWAPAYPWLMAAHERLFGFAAAITYTQIVVATLTIGLVYRLADRTVDRRAAGWAAWLVALDPTYAFYATSLWSETLYAGLLVGALLAVGWARDGGPGRAVLPGVLLGACVLFRGVATYMLPIVMLALVWDRWRDRAAWRGALACALATVLAVAPYSVYASRKFDGLVIADRTMGQMMWLGNNEFAPMTFDWGNGILLDRDYKATTARGRKHCPNQEDPVRWDACEVKAGVAWIRAHPDLFWRRVPLRVAQLLNPHSFLTRHLRWGKWRGLPDAVDEGLVVGVVGFSFLTVWGGTLGWLARGRGWYAVASGAVVLYHVAAIAVLAGLTRYRMPLEPLWAVWAGALLADPKGALRALRAAPRRAVVAVAVLGVLTALMLAFLPTGWPGWRTW